MTRVRVQGFQIFKDRHGKPRCYHRKTRIAVDLRVNPIGSAGRVQSLTDELEEVRKQCTKLKEQAPRQAQALSRSHKLMFFKTQIANLVDEARRLVPQPHAGQ